MAAKVRSHLAQFFRGNLVILIGFHMNVNLENFKSDSRLSHTFVVLTSEFCRTNDFKVVAHSHGCKNSHIFRGLAKLQR